MVEKQKKPNLFIIGMPRAGTTSLHYYLAAHPDIFMSESKEPHFFGNDLVRGFRATRISEREYLKLFSKARDEKILGESSTEYINSVDAADEIYNFNPSSKILILLRNPIDQCYSLHSKNFISGTDRCGDFEKAIDESREVKSSSWLLQSLYYKQNIRNLPANIRRYQNKFGVENVKLIIFDDLKDEPAKIYKDVLVFLGVDSNFSTDFTAHNANATPRSKLLLPWYIRLRSIKPLVFIKNLLLPFPVRKILDKQKPRPALPSELKRQLQLEFTPVVEELEIMTGRSLVAWKAET